MQHRVVIRRRRSGWFYAGLAALALVLAGTAWGLVRYGGAVSLEDGLEGLSEFERLRSERDQLAAQIVELRRQITELEGRQTFETRACEIDAEACRALRQTLSGLEQEAAEAREQLAFYRNIVSPEHQRAGVRVLELALIAGERPGLWRYDLVLVQGVGHDRAAAGRFQIAVEGSRDGRPQRLGANELGEGAAGSQAYSFKYFQEFGGELRLPAGFAPQRLTVTLLSDKAGAGESPVSENFEWTRLVAAGGSPR